MAPWKSVFLYQPVVFRVQVSLPGCKMVQAVSSKVDQMSSTHVFSSPHPFVVRGLSKRIKTWRHKPSDQNHQVSIHAKVWALWSLRVLFATHPNAIVCSIRFHVCIKTMCTSLYSRQPLPVLWSRGRVGMQSLQVSVPVLSRSPFRITPLWSTFISLIFTHWIQHFWEGFAFSGWTWGWRWGWINMNRKGEAEEGDDLSKPSWIKWEGGYWVSVCSGKSMQEQETFLLRSTVMEYC